MEIDDLRWEGLLGGYRRPYDPRPALGRLRAGRDVPDTWHELWNELHHQGSVGEASYVSVPALVEIHTGVRDLGWNMYALATCIEIQRHSRTNPPLPDWLAEDYKQAWEELAELALDDVQESRDPLVLRTALAACAVGRGQLKLGALICYTESSELDELLEARMVWSVAYIEDDLL